MDETYLSPGRLIESEEPAVVAFAAETVGDETDPTQKALKLFYAVRDEVRYDAYLPLADIKSYSGKEALATGSGWCVSKAALLAACARALGIPARPGYADVRNHMATSKLSKALGTDVFFWHSYCELQLNGRWIKCTPTFNKSLCDKFGLKTLDFDGEIDSLFHAFDKSGNKHMEYIRDRGHFTDVPYEDILATFRSKYLNMQDSLLENGIKGDFEVDAGLD
jgi:transglutaminase-like putative cysteine protease